MVIPLPQVARLQSLLVRMDNGAFRWCKVEQESLRLTMSIFRFRTNVHGRKTVQIPQMRWHPRNPDSSASKAAKYYIVLRRCSCQGPCPIPITRPVPEALSICAIVNSPIPGCPDDRNALRRRSRHRSDPVPGMRASKLVASTDEPSRRTSENVCSICSPHAGCSAIALHLLQYVASCADSTISPRASSAHFRLLLALKRGTSYDRYQWSFLAGHPGWAGKLSPGKTR